MSPSTTSDGAAPVVDDGHVCVQCGYSLTGLTSGRCPECGWEIDWAEVRARNFDLRPGTPAHRARGWRIIDRTLLTVVVMLFAPWKFARDLRWDEPIGPALAVAAISYLLFAVGIFIQEGFSAETWWLLEYYAGPTAVIICQCVAFSLLYYDRRFPRVTWWKRFRMWLVVSFYSTCFVAAWPLMDGPPIVYALTDMNFYCPLDDGGGYMDPEIGITIIYYWWWLILAVVFLLRNRPRWLAVIAIPLVYIFSWAGVGVVLGIAELVESLTQ